MRAERLEREFDLDVVWRPFELHPEIPEGGVERGEGLPRPRQHPEGYVSPIRALAEEEGLPYAPSRHTPNSHRALEAAEFAREQGAYAPFHRALFEAYFGRGEDIGDAGVLAKLAANGGLDAAAMEEALAESRYAVRVNELTEESRQQGITGTPTYVFESGERRFPLVGAQDCAVFQNIARRMGADSL